MALARQWCGHKVNKNIALDGWLNIDFPLMIFASTPHASLIKGMGILGIGQKNYQKIPTLINRESMDTESLENSLKSSTTPMKIVVASCGTVNSGDFDNLKEISKICKKYNAWLHIDAAFGIFAKCSDQYKHLAKGLKHADSITADAHKWLNVPYDCGILLTKHIKLLQETCGVSAPYLQELEEIPNFSTLGIENSRRFRALPVWMTLKVK